MRDWRKRRSNKRLQIQQTAESIQLLEDRTLLTGNVVASLSGPNLFVTGDAADNQLEVTVVNNQVVLRGLTNTTINGSSALFVIADNTDTAPGKITILTGAGNDTVIFSRNVKVAGNAFVDGGVGNDSLSVTGATFQQSISMYGRIGNDTISVQNATVEGVLRLKGNSGNDLVSVTNTTANGGTNIVGGTGSDGVSFNNYTANAWTKISTGTGDDNISIVNSNVNGFLRVKTRQGADVLQMDANTVNGNVAVNMGRNNDAVKLVNTNRFNGAFRVQAGDGHPIISSDPQIPSTGDQVDLGATTVFALGSRVRKAETSTVSTTVSDSIDAATTGLKARATAADSAAVLLILDVALDNSANTTTDSVGSALITRNADFTVAGTTLPGAVVTLDTDGDGNFDNGTLTADSLGKFSTVVTLQRTDLNPATTANDQLNGFNKIKIRSTVSGVGSKDTEVDVDYVPSTNKIVQFVTNQGTYEVEMFNDLTPNTVANFLSYESRYTNAIVQRSETTPASTANNTPARAFVIQAGGFTQNNGSISQVPVNTTTLINEFNAATSNVRGTISMALQPGTSNTSPDHLNSGTSQWFINLSNNNGEAILNNDGQPVTGTGSNAPDLDDAKHTVFGRVMGNGMTVVDKIAAIATSNISTASGYSALSTVPLTTPFTALTKTLTGTVSATTGSTTVTGVGTKFLSELHGVLAGDPTGTGSRIEINGATLRVKSIESDTSLTLDTAPTATSAEQTARTDEFADANFVKFSSIAEILSV